jgi:hypothetical protein
MSPTTPSRCSRAVLNPDSLKEAELDAMAEADAVMAREDNSGASGPIR